MMSIMSSSFSGRWQSSENLQEDTHLCVRVCGAVCGRSKKAWRGCNSNKYHCLLFGIGWCGAVMDGIE